MTSKYIWMACWVCALLLAGCSRQSSDTAVPPPVTAAPTSVSVGSESQAIKLVVAAIHANHQTSLSDDCLRFRVVKVDDVSYHIDVREVHNAACGGDPQTAPRLVSFVVDKRSGSVTTDNAALAR